MLSLAAVAVGSSTISSFLAELLLISAVALSCKYLRLPYTIALVAAGLLVGLLRGYFELEVQLTPDLLFVILLPILLFEGAIHLPLQLVLAQIRPILLLAVPGLLITTALVGWTLHLLLDLPLSATLVFGALISATDPIAVLALFKELKAPKELTVIVEGESLLNDGTAVVVFHLLVTAALGGKISPFKGCLMFLLEAGGGLLLGAALGWLVWKAQEKIDDHLIEMTLSTILAYGSYLLAQQLHASGVMAVIAAGLVYGNFAMSQSMSANTRLALGSSWDYLGFLCNSLVFLLIGTQVDLSLLLSRSGPILLAFVVVTLARALAVAVLAPWARLPGKWYPVVIWAGLRGSIAMALAMAINLPQRQEILLLTFGCVLLSVFVQGLSIKGLLHRLGMGFKSESVRSYEADWAELAAQEKALALLRNRRSRRLISQDVYEQMARPLERAIRRLEEKVAENEARAEIRDQQYQEAAAALSNARRWALREAFQKNQIDEKTYLELGEKLSRVSEEEP
ncbi:MAG: Na+/H+ antiporter [Candidatus Eremiobacteraeota bacterium]|nr:Na+/H+ antiporter [Candidatus Eremiobacteraeota bacterium]MCW5870560.1 Na+/H+ antiporter [Candidatus Eremiobacteraeota bacterium]